MAKKINIGAGIALDGEREFKQAVSNINKDLSVLGSEMGKVTAQFGNNANSMDALKAKSEVYNKQIDEQKNKIELLKKALENSAKEYGETDKKTKDWQISLNKAEAELAKTENALENTEKAMDDFGKSADEAGGKFDKMGGVLKGVGVAIGAVAVAAGAAAVKMAKDVIKSFGELEQNLGGSEAVFGEYADTIQKTGEEAYKNLGVSQSEYLATANKMGALFQGSGLEQQRSLELTEQAMQRAADMASVMGIDMSSAMEAVTGAAKGNFTMMDNLGVAMNATTLEAYALSKGITTAYKDMSQTEKTELAMQMFFENTEQYAGNFARESTETISGSMGLLQAALGSFTAGLGNANADMTNLTGNLVDAFGSVVENIIPVIENVVAALPAAIDAMLPLIGDLLPKLLDAIINIFEKVLDATIKLLPELIPVAVDALITIVGALIENLPMLIDAAFQMIVALIDGIVLALPELLPMVVEVVIQIVQTLIDNIPLLIQAGIDLFTALIRALPDIIIAIVRAIPDIIDGIITALIDSIPLLIEAGVELFIALIENLPTIIIEIVKAIPKIIDGIVKAFTKLFPKIVELGGNLLKGIWNGIKDAGAWLWDKISGFFGGIVNKIKGFFGISSPSKLFASLGKFMAEGLGDGFGDEMKTVADEMNNSIPTSFDSPSLYGSNARLYSTTSGGGYAAGGNGNIVFNAPMYLDGHLLTASTSILQYRRNQSRARAVGVTI